MTLNMKEQPLHVHKRCTHGHCHTIILLVGPAAAEEADDEDDAAHHY